MIIFILFILSVITKLINEYQRINIYMWDFVINGLTDPLVCIVILPILYIFLSADLIMADINNKYVGYVLNRTKFRSVWLFSKIAALFLGSFVFSILSIIVYAITAFVFGFPLKGEFSGNSIMYASTPILSILLLLFSSYILTLTSLGTLILSITMLIRNVAIAFTFCIILCCISYGTFTRHDFTWAFPWMPTTKMFILQNIPNNLTNPMLNSDLSWSYLYNVVLITISIALCLLQIRMINLSK